MSFEFGQVVELSHQIENIARNSEEAILKTAQDLAEIAIGQVKMLTPVDTGDLRQNWEVDVAKNGKEVQVILHNPMEYAAYVELGHRIVAKVEGVRVTVGWVEGAFMATMTMEELTRYVGRIFNQHLGDLMG